MVLIPQRSWPSVRSASYSARCVVIRQSRSSAYCATRIRPSVVIVRGLPGAGRALGVGRPFEYSLASWVIWSSASSSGMYQGSRCEASWCSSRVARPSRPRMPDSSNARSTARCFSMSGRPTMKSSSAVRPLRMPSTQHARAATWISSAFISSPVARITPSTIGQTASSSPRPLQRFWNAWLCVLIRPGTARRPLASIVRARPAGREASSGAIREIVPPVTSIVVPGTIRYCSPFAPPRIAVALVTTRSTSAASSPFIAVWLWLTSPPRVSRCRVSAPSSPHSLSSLAGLVPAADDLVGDEPDEREREDPEERRGDDRTEELLGGERGAVVVDQAPDARVALAEEEVAHDRPDHRQARRDLQTDEDRGQRRGKLEFAQARPSACAPQREDVLQSRRHAAQPEERVRDHREQRDEHAHEHAATEVETPPEADQRDDREDRHRLQYDSPRKERALDPVRLRHCDGDRNAEERRDPEADDRDLRRLVRRDEDLVARVGLDEAPPNDGVRRGEQEASLRVECDVGGEVPHADRDPGDDQRRHDDADQVPDATAAFPVAGGVLDELRLLDAVVRER